MIPDAFYKVLESLNVALAVVADLQSGEVRFIGEQEAMGNTDLISTLFANRETIESVDRSLEGQVLPRVWNQGNVCCIVCKPANQTIVGLFATDELDTVQLYRWSREADQAIRAAFSATGP